MTIRSSFHLSFLTQFFLRYFDIVYLHIYVARFIINSVIQHSSELYAFFL